MSDSAFAAINVAPSPAPAAPTAPAPTAPVSEADAPMAAALTDLRAWRDLHVPNSPLSRNTTLLNRVAEGLRIIETALASLKE